MSIIVCTHNHRQSLQGTVAALGAIAIPESMEVELLLIENACTDDTGAFVDQVKLPNMTCRGLHENRVGLSHARNLGLKNAQGECIVFTDDDVRPSPDWLVALAPHLVDGHCDAVMGAIRLAPHLERPWMKSRHRAVLAVSEGLEDGGLKHMIGANMAFHRRVLSRVPEFDTELGAGALGFSEDTLFSMQLTAAGYRIGRAANATVTHHCSPARLRRSSFLDAARKGGRSQAYVAHHWEHSETSHPVGRLALAQLKLLRRRLISRNDLRIEEGCAEWEFSLEQQIATIRQYLKERRRPRNYTRRGLRKLA